MGNELSLAHQCMHGNRASNNGSPVIPARTLASETPYTGPGCLFPASFNNEGEAGLSSSEPPLQMGPWLSARGPAYLRLMASEMGM